MTKKEILNRRQFQAQLATSLILANTHNTTPKRGQPSSGKTFTLNVTSGSPLDPQKRPSSTDLRSKRGRCRHCNNGYTNTLCSKCNVRLCLLEEKNCFVDYHCN
ncbi:piggyBac transposable element-derived protein 3-like [Tachysurus ichikawai]